jgi:hypothetical protein
VTAKRKGAGCEASDPFGTLDIFFNRDVQGGTLTADDIQMTGPSGALTVSDPVKIAPAQFRLSLGTQTALATYVLQVGPHVVGDDGQEMDQNGNGTPGEAADAYRGACWRAGRRCRPAATASGAMATITSWPDRRAWTSTPP